jgi:hypothetical protein
MARQPAESGNERLGEEIRHHDQDDRDHGDADLHQGDERAIAPLMGGEIIACRSRIFEFAVVGHRISPHPSPSAREISVIARAGQPRSNAAVAQDAELLVA